MNKNNSKYSASFTAGALLLRETDALLEVLFNENSKILIESEIKNNQLIQINSESSRKRVIVEIVKRFNAIDKKIWTQFRGFPDNEKKITLFYACLKTYPLIFDFHFDVTLLKWKASANKIDKFLYRMKLDEIGMNDPEVDQWTEQTKDKTISVYMRILRDIGMLQETKLVSITARKEFWSMILIEKDHWFLDACLISPTQKKEILNYCS
ncbi:MAG: BrxA family protein [Bacteroidota bacterium]